MAVKDGVRGANERITAEVVSWPGVSAGVGSRGEWGFTLGRRALGHLHGDHVLHIGFPRALGAELREQGRVVDHPVFPGNDGWAARRIEAEGDVEDAIALLRMNYDRAVERHGLPDEVEAGLEQLLPGLHATVPELIFGGSTEIRSFVVDRGEHGLALISQTARVAASAAAIARLGEVRSRYLVHWHEAMFGDDPGAAVGGELVVGEADRDEAAARGARVGRTVAAHAFEAPDIQLIPAPGHTPGTMLVLWDSGSHRILFSGDTLFPDAAGEWRVAVLDSSDRAAYVGTLEMIRELDFDVLAPWAVERGAAPIALTDRADLSRRLDTVLARVREGADR